jgi:hypothetical protein
MNNYYEVILKRKTEKGDPVITPVIVSEKVWNELVKVVYRQHGDQEITGDEKKDRHLQKAVLSETKRFLRKVKRMEKEYRVKVSI